MTTATASREADQFASIEPFVLGLVCAIILRQPRLAAHRDDIEADARLSAAQAIRRFRPERGVKLVTYVGSCVEKNLRALVKRYYMDVCHVPIYLFHNAKPNHAANAAQAAFMLRMPNSLDESRGGFGGGEDTATTLGAQIPDPKTPEAPISAIHSEYEREIAQALRRLGERTCEIMTRRFGLGGTAPETLDEVGARVGLSRERVRQIEVSTLVKLRTRLAFLEEN